MMHPISAKPPASITRQRGFSLFEMIIYILAASILFSAAFNRYRDFPGEAERANFQAIVAQLNAAINLQMMRTIASGEFQQAAFVDGINPMDLMLTVPDNYVGVLSAVDPSALPRRIWYFDGARGELVYLANDASNLYWVQNGSRQPADSVRFQVRNVFGAAQRWEGIVLAPVVPYEWQAVALEIPNTEG
jgi:type II secretory pathway pseudopilin PulG